ncbi:peptide-methionine (S)-S-oxide reductase MsrA [Novosphingobium sp. TH158]|uniref:peptide-methionine (S)-S-oxide reductase MsrA n=1 Tax=Novosphingobium sp. TH158 TaxID=2067455 RepID=UPI000C7B1111|nr:peptide-methionine (S)-S-oxide reductase MsrA [Novosphingobium sp. TH158]PLK27075.1 peptide-methionine (S)-S-oxide reductase [Novosphingobium sp. TH158]
MKRGLALIPLLLVLSACQQGVAASARDSAVNAPAAARKSAEPAGLKVAVFSGGCFWGTEAVFSHVKGVTSAVSGYQGGSRSSATYDRVKDSNTGHAESVRVTYDPAQVRYDQLLQIFFSVIADPTQLNRQGPDVGTQYRSALVPQNAEQKLVASAYLAQLRASGLWRAPIVTRIEPSKGFYAAEAEHQDFAARNPQHPYITYWDVPKLAALKRLFPGLYKPSFTKG